MRFLGIDHSKTAIKTAQARFEQRNVEFRLGDLRTLTEMDLGFFDLIIALNTLQSPELDGQAIVRDLTAHHLNDGGTFILDSPTTNTSTMRRFSGPV